MNKNIPYFATVIIAIFLLYIGHITAVDGLFILQDDQNETVRARVLTIVERSERTASDFEFFDDFGFFDDSDFFDSFDDEEFDFSHFLYVPGTTIIFEARVTRGIRRGEIITAEQSFNPFLPDRSKEIARGDNILLVNNNFGWFFGGYVRTNGLIGLGVLFIFCLLFFGRKKGFNTILSLAFTCASIFAVFVPAILSGKNIYLMAILVCIYTIAMTLLIVIGYNKKSLAAVAGCTGGVIVAAIIALIMDRVLNLTGLVDEHSRHLIHLPGDVQLNLNALIFAGIIIGAMGAIMDVAISISSSLWEIKENAKIIKLKELFRSGMNIGRDIMGSMANTLILAYIGSSLTVVLLLAVYSGSFLNLFNSEMIAVEILQALAGSLGILFAMPLTAFFCSVLFLKDKSDFAKR